MLEMKDLMINTCDDAEANKAFALMGY